MSKKCKKCGAKLYMKRMAVRDNFSEEKVCLSWKEKVYFVLKMF